MSRYSLLSSRSTALVALLSLGGCATFSDIVSDIKAGIRKDPNSSRMALAEQPLQEPIDANVFTLASSDQSVIGETQVVFTTDTDTLSGLARAYGLGYDDIVAANPGIDPWLPGENIPVLLPTRFVLPNVPRRGVVLNIATKRLFYFPVPADGEVQQVLTYPIGIGRVGWETPLGETTVVAKAKNPSWWVPASVRREHVEKGDPLPAVVPPGPENPLGTRVLKLNMPGYLIHGTNQPYGVGMRVSHGCVRLYPENIETLYTLIDVGEDVTIINEPYQLAYNDGALLFEAHAPLEDDAVAATDRLQTLLDTEVDVAGEPLNELLRARIKAVAKAANGVPASVATLDEDDLFARVRVVRNVVEHDSKEFTLDEIREMMEEISEQQDALQL